jgi:hypothetical protein
VVANLEETGLVISYEFRKAVTTAKIQTVKKALEATGRQGDRGNSFWTPHYDGCTCLSGCQLQAMGWSGYDEAVKP